MFDGTAHTYRMHPYKGIGHLPKGLRPGSAPDKRILLDQLPRLLRGYGKSQRDTGAAVVVVVDQDDEKCEELKADLRRVLNACNPKPTTLFRIAVEELDAWLLGDRTALLEAYPKAKAKVLDGYVQDSVCGTWEVLADAVHPSGARALKERGWPEIGQAKCRWAEDGGSRLDLGRNQSHSFRGFCEGIRRLVGQV